MQRTALSVLAVLLLAGCAAPDNAPPANTIALAKVVHPRADPTDPPLPAVLDMEHCDALELYFPFPSDDGWVPAPLRPRTIDPAGTLLQATFAFRRCESVRLDGELRANATVLGWILIPVEPAPSLRIDGVHTYYWLDLLIGHKGPLLDRMAAHGIERENATLSLRFLDMLGSKAAQAEFAGRMDDFEATAGSHMFGPLTPVPVRNEGLYTGRNAENLRVHGFDVSARTQYEHGLARIAPAFLPLPMVSDVLPHAVAASHVLGFSAQWRLANADA